MALEAYEAEREENIRRNMKRMRELVQVQHTSCTGTGCARDSALSHVLFMLLSFAEGVVCPADWNGIAGGNVIEVNVRAAMYLLHITGDNSPFGRRGRDLTAEAMLFVMQMIFPHIHCAQPLRCFVGATKLR